MYIFLLSVLVYSLLLLWDYFHPEPVPIKWQAAPIVKLYNETQRGRHIH